MVISGGDFSMALCLSSTAWSMFRVAFLDTAPIYDVTKTSTDIS